MMAIPYALTFGMMFFSGLPWWIAAALAVLVFPYVRSVLFGPVHRCRRHRRRSPLGYLLAAAVIGLGAAGLFQVATSIALVIPPCPLRPTFQGSP
jgi:FAD/FMN-containing dehydrogenase